MSMPLTGAGSSGPSYPTPSTTNAGKPIGLLLALTTSDAGRPIGGLLLTLTKAN